MLGALALVTATVSVYAQAKPSFAGKWTLVPAEGEAGGGGGRGGRGGRGGGGGGGFACGMECTITQDAAMLKVERMAGENMVSATFKLDGTDSVNTSMGRGGETQVTSKAMWEGNNLVVTTTNPNGEVKSVISMEGGMLKVARTAPGRGGGEPTTTTTTYKKGM
jgi:hypothetical protein